VTISTPEQPQPEQPAVATTTAISDQRPRPRGVLPRGMQMWLMMGLAAVLLAIITLTGHPDPKDVRRSERPNTAPIDAERVAAFQQQLRERQQQLAREAERSVPSSSPAPRTPDVGEREPSRDPLDEARKRKEYESLFASSVAFTRGGRQTDAASPKASSPTGIAESPTDTLATLDAQARESLRRLNASVAQLESADGRSPSVPSAAVRETTRAGAEQRAGTPPAATAAIVPGTATHRILEGTIIDAEVRTPVAGETGGKVICQITANVWSFNRDAIVIPKGSTVLGDSTPVAAMGQRLLAMSFHRIIFPDGSTHGLDQASGLDQTGTTGIRANVNTHVWSTFGAAAVVGLISGATEAIGSGAVSGGSDRTVVIAGGGAGATGQRASQVLAPYTNRLPTLSVPAGRRIKIFLTRDLELPTFHDGRLAGPAGR
jgi:type IV secretory pathway VirB10-like protein